MGYVGYLLGAEKSVPIQFCIFQLFHLISVFSIRFITLLILIYIYIYIFPATRLVIYDPQGSVIIGAQWAPDTIPAQVGLIRVRMDPFLVVVFAIGEGIRKPWSSDGAHFGFLRVL